MSRIVREKFPISDYDALEDVLGDVLLDLLGYWSGLDSSRQENGYFSFRFAIQRGCWMGKRKMWEAQRYNAKHTRISFSDDADWDEDENGEPSRFTDVYRDLIDEDPTPESVVEELDDAQRAHAVLAGFTPSELEDYFDTILTDESQSAVADRLGVSQSAISQRRSVRARRLKDSAVKFGLVP